MELKKVTFRVKKIVYERLKLLAEQRNEKFQDLVNETLEIGIIELIRGDSNAK